MVLETLSTDVRIDWLTLVPTGRRLFGNHQHEHRSRRWMGRVGSVLSSLPKRWFRLRRVLEMFQEEFHAWITVFNEQRDHHLPWKGANKAGREHPLFHPTRWRIF